MIIWNAFICTLFITSLAACGAAKLTGNLAPTNDIKASPYGKLIRIADMQYRRAAHTATALPDGRVLIIGGFSEEEDSPNGNEVYDPSARKFSSFSPLITPRHSHTATLLPDGKVLIVGGYGKGTTTLASAELYDPATNTFQQTGSLSAPRANHSAILLRNGKVLIAGGEGSDWTTLSSAEIYDPATGKFSTTGSMNIPGGGQGTLLQDGRVLFAGGHNRRRGHLNILKSAEVYDPATGKFSRTGDLLVRRHKHSAILLNDGRVLITGGSDDRDNNGMYNSTEFYNPKTESFEAGPLMKLARFKHGGTSVLLRNGLLLISGGALKAEVFDPKTNSFSIVPAETGLAGSASAVAMLNDGSVLITGGYGNGTGPRSSAWLYLP